MRAEFRKKRNLASALVAKGLASEELREICSGRRERVGAGL